MQTFVLALFFWHRKGGEREIAVERLPIPLVTVCHGGEQVIVQVSSKHGSYQICRVGQLLVPGSAASALWWGKLWSILILIVNRMEATIPSQ